MKYLILWRYDLQKYEFFYFMKDPIFEFIQYLYQPQDKFLFGSKHMM